PPTTGPDADPEPAYDKPPPKKNRSYFSLGMGEGSAKDIEEWQHGPSYRAFIDQDLIVATTDLKSVAEALDVIAGKTPSLAKEDPHSFKENFPAGVMVAGAGVTADFGRTDEAAANSKGGTTQPSMVSTSKTGGFGLDLFGSF